MAPARRRAAALVALACLLLATSGVAAAPPPQPLCELYDDRRYADEEPALEATNVDRSLVTVTVDDDGTGHWRVRLALLENVSADEGALTAAAERRLNGHRGHAEPRNVSVTTAGDSLVATYEVPGMATQRPGGVLVMDYFYGHGESGRDVFVNADRFVLRGPDGTTMTRKLSGTGGNGTAMVMRGSHRPGSAVGPDDRRAVPEGFVVFAPEETPVTTVATHLGVGVDIADAKLSDLGDGALLPTLVLTAVLAVAVRYRGRLGDASPRYRLAAVAGVAGGLAVLTVAFAPLLGESGYHQGLGEQYAGAVFLLGVLGAATGVPALGIVLGSVAAQYLLASPDYEPTVPARWVVGTAAGLGVAALVLGPLALGNDTAAARLYGFGVAVLAPLLFVPMGLATRRRIRILLGAVIVAAPALIVVGLGPFGGFTAMFFPLTFVPWALVGGTIGALAYVSLPDADWS